MFARYETDAVIQILYNLCNLQFVCDKIDRSRRGVFIFYRANIAVTSDGPFISTLVRSRTSSRAIFSRRTTRKQFMRICWSTIVS